MHTQGPWEFEGGERVGGPNALPRWKLYRQEFPDTAGQVGAGIVAYSCSTFAYLNAEEGNARLIAAAPEMYEALRRALNWLSSYPGGGAMAAYDQARAAIDKASQSI